MASTVTLASRLQHSALSAVCSLPEVSQEHGRAFPEARCSRRSMEEGVEVRLSSSRSAGFSRSTARQVKIGLQARNGRKLRTQTTALVKEAEQLQVAETSTIEQTEVDENLKILYDEAEQLVVELKGANVFLIGMMGCGKSTVGGILSDALGYAFFDSDTVVEKTVGTTVAQIFTEQGEAAFRQLESHAVSQLSSMENLVVATGGGAILRAENWKHMRTGVVVWIDVPLKALAKRVVAAGVGSRPILSQGSSDKDAFSQALDRLSSVYQKRKHLYPQADVRVSLEAIASEIGSDGVADVSPARIALEILREARDVVSRRAASWQLPGSEALECVRDEFGQCMVPYGLEDSENSATLQQVLAC